VSQTRQLAGGGRAVEVEPERLHRFLDRFAASHGGAVGTRCAAEHVELTTTDGSVATVPVPFGPLRAGLGDREGLDVEHLVAHLLRPRTVGLLLVRLGGYTVGVARDGVVLVSRTGARPVHGRTAAGGQSQQRFARRRAGQARVALHAAADATAAVLLPRSGELDGLVLGGDRGALRVLAGDRRLATLLASAEPRVLDVPEPRRVVLDEAARRARAVEVQLRSSH
jgi:hypothetical protein